MTSPRLQSEYDRLYPAKASERPYEPAPEGPSIHPIWILTAIGALALPIGWFGIPAYFWVIVTVGKWL